MLSHPRELLIVAVYPAEETVGAKASMFAACDTDNGPLIARTFTQCLLPCDTGDVRQSRKPELPVRRAMREPLQFPPDAVP